MKCVAFSGIKSIKSEISVFRIVENTWIGN